MNLLHGGMVWRSAMTDMSTGTMSSSGGGGPEQLATFQGFGVEVDLLHGAAKQSLVYAVCIDTTAVHAD